MRVSVGYSENTDSRLAGSGAAREALRKAGGDAAPPFEATGSPDLILLFSTARHDPETLRAGVRSVYGDRPLIVGGGACGAISNDRFGYAGDQVILAVFWLENSRCDVYSESGLEEDEKEAGLRLGRKLAVGGIAPDSPLLLFYDAIDRSREGVRIVAATHLLRGIEDGLGFLPDLVGAGLQGDYFATSSCQWNGRDIVRHSALALSFPGSVRMDHIIMHGCRPATSYYRVTRAEQQAILEINGEPAIDFLDRLLGPSIKPEDYPFFLILGINKGEKWGEFDEKSYINHLCLGIDRERGAILMFEPDMVAGTEFQIMYRSLELDYMAPRIEQLFQGLGGREPVFALYIDCAGRAGYGGVDLEDAVMVQKMVADRVPLLGIYTGVEIAAVEGHPRGLDWTGVFCLFSVQK